jgi:hypothetical protein
MTILLLPEQENRVESGAVQFGNDWPGVFIRGDNALFYAMALKRVLEMPGERLPLDVQINLRDLFAVVTSAIVGSKEGLELKEPVTR